jgi:hypothetical protein
LLLLLSLSLLLLWERLHLATQRHRPPAAAAAAQADSTACLAPDCWLLFWPFCSLVYPLLSLLLPLPLLLARRQRRQVSSVLQAWPEAAAAPAPSADAAAEASADWTEYVVGQPVANSTTTTSRRDDQPLNHTYDP